MVRTYSIIFAVTAVLFVVFINMTRPDVVPSVFYIVPFLLLGVAVYALTMTIGALLVRFQILTISRKLLKRLAILASLYVSFLLLLQSIGQLTIRDVVIGLILITLLYLYFDRMITDTPMAG